MPIASFLCLWPVGLAPVKVTASWADALGGIWPNRVFSVYPVQELAIYQVGSARPSINKFRNDERREEGREERLEDGKEGRLEGGRRSLGIERGGMVPTGTAWCGAFSAVSLSWAAKPFIRSLACWCACYSPPWSLRT